MLYNYLKAMENKIPDKNLFMMCPRVNKDAFGTLPEGYYIRNCREAELDIWKAMPFDVPETAGQYYDFMSTYFDNAYKKRQDEFFEKCKFVCDKNDKPLGTCFLWKIYEKINTLHWFKIIKEHENKGLGRALLTTIMRDIPENEYPVYLHTQPSSYRAIKLYTDFGFCLLSDPVIGSRTNDIKECMKILKHYMPKPAFQNLKTVQFPKDFLDILKSETINQF
jgi:ribosomal protein S18 acetylase RimI-like enzyme